MTYLQFCRRCMTTHGFDPDETPDPGCNVCGGTGYVPATQAQIAVYRAAAP